MAKIIKKVSDLAEFKDGANAMSRKEAIGLGIAGGLSFAFGAYIQCLENAGSISKKEKWTLFTLLNGVAIAGTLAQHYETAKRCLNALGDVDLGEVEITEF